MKSLKHVYSMLSIRYKMMIFVGSALLVASVMTIYGVVSMTQDDFEQNTHRRFKLVSTLVHLSFSQFISEVRTGLDGLKNNPELTRDTLISLGTSRPRRKNFFKFLYTLNDLSKQYSINQTSVYFISKKNKKFQLYGTTVLAKDQVISYSTKKGTHLKGRMELERDEFGMIGIKGVSDYDVVTQSNDAGKSSSNNKSALHSYAFPIEMSGTEMSFGLHSSGEKLYLDINYPIKNTSLKGKEGGFAQLGMTYGVIRAFIEITPDWLKKIENKAGVNLDIFSLKGQFLLGNLNTPITLDKLRENETFSLKTSTQKFISYAVPLKLNEVEAGFLVASVSQAELTAQLWKIIWTIIGIIALTSSISLFLIDYVLTRTFIKNLFSILGIVRRISEGDLNHHVPVTTIDEFGILAKAVNKMSDALSQAYFRLELLLKTTKDTAAAGIAPYAVMEIALMAILKIIPVISSSKITIYYRKKDNNVNGYAIFHIPIDKDFDRISLLDKEENPYYSFSNKIPDEVESENFPKESVLIDDILFLPCWENEKFLGLIKVQGIDNKAFSKEMLDFINTLRQSLILSLENIEFQSEIEEKARMQGELKTAAAVQKALFPKAVPQISNLELADFYRSASETGGDWCGFFTQIKKHVFLCIGDVTGHGTPAALVTATASATCRMVETMYMMGYEIPSPAKLLSRLNKTIYETGAPDHLMTFFAACIDLETGQTVFSNAGHNFPFLIRMDGTVKRLKNANDRLGDRKENDFMESTIDLQEGDTLFLYTDGLIENENCDGKMWGDGKLRRYLKSNYTLSAKELVDKIVKEAYEFFDGQPLDDDLTIVACKVTKPFSE